MIPSRYRLAGSYESQEFRAFRESYSARASNLRRIPVPAPSVDPLAVAADLRDNVSELFERLNHLSGFGAGAIAEPLRQHAADLRVIVQEASSQLGSITRLREYADQLHAEMEQAETAADGRNKERDRKIQVLLAEIEVAQSEARDARRHAAVLIEEMRREHRSGLRRRDAVSRVIRAASERMSSDA